MRLQPASENNIVHGLARIMGAVVASTGQKAWILPGRRYTVSRDRAEHVAKEINRLAR